jgi:hypothetical protein
MTTKNSGFQIIRFLQSAGAIGGGSVGLAIVLFAVSIIEHFIDKKINAYWFVLVGAAFFAFGSYTAWERKQEALTKEIEKNTKPSLNVELKGAFFDNSKMPNNELQTHIYAYLKVTNINDPETLIKDGALVMTVGGNRHKGFGDDSSVKGNVIEHISNFRIGGEKRNADVMGNTFSPFPKLLLSVNAGNPLRRGITQEGFIVFTFSTSIYWSPEESSDSIMPASEIYLTLRDSFNGVHGIEQMLLKIPAGRVATETGLFSHWTYESG